MPTVHRTGAIPAICCCLMSGCDNQPPAAVPSAGAPNPQALSLGLGATTGPSDPDKIRAADFSVLFVGNSHTAMHDLPTLVGQMMAFRYPDKKVYTHYLAVGFLEQVAGNPAFETELAGRPWKHVVLQGQKISMSGKFNYSRTEAIDYAKALRANQAQVLFFVEWGRQGVAGDGVAQEKIYLEMADAAGAGIAPVSRAWDLALAKRPEMALHAPDGNHQTALGAFLTACVLYARITGESPAALATFPYDDASASERELLAQCAAAAVAKTPGQGVKP